MAKNIGIANLATIVNLSANFILSIIIARFLGVSPLGIYALGVAVAGFSFSLLELGTKTIMTREVAKDLSLHRKYPGGEIHLHHPHRLSHHLSLRILLLSGEFTTSPPYWVFGCLRQYKRGFLRNIPSKGKVSLPTPCYFTAKGVCYRRRNSHPHSRRRTKSTRLLPCVNPGLSSFCKYDTYRKEDNPLKNCF